MRCRDEGRCRALQHACMQPPAASHCFGHLWQTPLPIALPLLPASAASVGRRLGCGPPSAGRVSGAGSARLLPLVPSAFPGALIRVPAPLPCALPRPQGSLTLPSLFPSSTPLYPKRSGGAAQLEYKYVVRSERDKTAVRWKEGQNCQLQLPAQGRLRVSDTWDDSAREVEVSGGGWPAFRAGTAQFEAGARWQHNWCVLRS